jgi:CheY-like chemotaxis protein
MAQILVVDDHPDSRDALCRFLTSMGHNVICAASGRDALTAVIDRPPDLIISDLMMPDMNGAALVETLRSYLRLQSVPLILWTGAGESLIVERARKFGVSAVLVKGITALEEIQGAVDRALAEASG